MKICRAPRQISRAHQPPTLIFRRRRRHRIRRRRRRLTRRRPRRHRTPHRNPHRTLPRSHRRTLHRYPLRPRRTVRLLRHLRNLLRIQYQLQVIHDFTMLRNYDIQENLKHNGLHKPINNLFLHEILLTLEVSRPFFKVFI